MDRSFWHGVQFWVEALDTWSVVKALPIEAVQVQYHTARGAEPLRPVVWGQGWAEPDAACAVLEARLEVSPGAVRLVVDVDGEALLRIDGVPAWGVNPNHREADVSREAGRSIHVAVEVVPRGAFGRPLKNPQLRSMALRQIDPDIERVRWDLAVLRELGVRAATPLAVRNWLAPRLLEAIRPLMQLPPDLAAWEARERRRPDASVEASLYQRLIAHPGAVVGLNAVDRAALARAAAAAGERLRALSAELAATWPAGVGRLVAVGHAHIDLAWLWPIGETRRKILRTVATQDRLLDAFPDWGYLMSSPEMWQGVQDTEPALFRRMQAQLGAGRLQPAGASWVECDAQLPSAAAVLRHLRYAGRYFTAQAGERPRVAFLPDTFGFAGGWPTLLRLAGVDMMVTTKLMWNDTTRFPYTDFVWVGPDGSQVAVQLYGGAAAGYNGDGTLDDLDRAWANYEERGGTDRVLYTFGFGDGGGGPTREMLERLTRYREMPLVPRVEWGRLEDLIPEGTARARWPQHRGDLYLEYHRGVFTTQTAVKSGNRRWETRLNAVEAWSALAGIPAGELEDAWRRVLRNQFHDILPGSSIAEVYQDWREDMAAVEAVVEDRWAHVMAALPGGGSEAVLAVANAAGAAVPPSLQVFSAPGPVEVFTDGEWRPAAATHDGRWVVPVPGQPALSVARYALRPARDAAGMALGDVARQGDAVVVPLPEGRVAIGPEGIRSLVHGGRELVAAPSGIRGYLDHPAHYDAWELSPQYRETPVAWRHDSVAVAEHHPWRTVVRLIHRTGETVVTEYVAVDRQHGQVSAEVAADVRDRHLVVRWELETTLSAAAVDAEGLWGMSRHPTVPEAESQQAAFEWVAHRFVSLAEAQVGVAIANDGRYGHSAEGGRLGVTLSTAPLYPDPDADHVPAPIRLLIVPHGGRWATPAVHGAAQAWSHGVSAVVAEGTPGLYAPVAGLPENVVVLGLWPASDDSGDLVLTLGEVYGMQTEAVVSLGRGTGAASVDPISEAPGGKLAVAWDQGQQAMRVTLPAFGIGVVRWQAAPAEAAK